MSPATTAASTFVRRAVLISVGGTTGHSAYKARTDPPHLFWDLDHTLLCSVSPLPTPSFVGSGHADHFDQIDDDFPYDSQTNAPNTRTYIRPGARAALNICGLFGVQHVYTAAQGTYTRNILASLDPRGEIFETVTHRDDVSVRKGKDLSLRTDRLDRAVLFDDRAYNFEPQRHRNGVVVAKYEVEGNSSVDEFREMARLVGVAFLALNARDVRDVVRWVRGREENGKEGNGN